MVIVDYSFKFTPKRFTFLESMKKWQKCSLLANMVWPMPHLAAAWLQLCFPSWLMVCLCIL